MSAASYDKLRLPARPLVDVIDRLFARAGGDEPGNEAQKLRGRMYEQLGVNQKRLYEWRRLPRAGVQFNVADRILTSTPYLWFDVWVECPRDAEHQVAVMDTGTCPRCKAYELARFAFTGKPMPTGKCLDCGCSTSTRGAKRCRPCANRARA